MNGCARQGRGGVGGAGQIEGGRTVQTLFAINAANGPGEAGGGGGDGGGGGGGGRRCWRAEVHLTGD